MHFLNTAYPLGRKENPVGSAGALLSLYALKFRRLVHYYQPLRGLYEPGLKSSRFRTRASRSRQQRCFPGPCWILYGVAALSSSVSSGSLRLGLYLAKSLWMRGWSGFSSSDRCQCSRARSCRSIRLLSSR